MKKENFIYEHDKLCTIEINGKSIDGKIYLNDINDIFFLHNHIGDDANGCYPNELDKTNYEYNKGWMLYENNNIKLGDWKFIKWLDQVIIPEEPSDYEKGDKVKLLIDLYGYKKDDIGTIIEEQGRGYTINVKERISTSAYEPYVNFSVNEFELYKGIFEDEEPQFGSPGDSKYMNIDDDHYFEDELPEEEIENKSKPMKEEDKSSWFEPPKEKPKQDKSLGDVLAVILFISIFFVITYKVISFIIKRINIFINSIKNKKKKITSKTKK